MLVASSSSRCSSPSCSDARPRARARDAEQCPHGDRVLRARAAHPGLSRRGRLLAARRRRDARLQRVARPAAGGGRRGRAARAGGRQPLPGPVQLGAAPRAGQPLRRRPEPDRDRQRLLRHPARRRRGAARAGRRARLRLAVVQRLPAPRRGVRRPRDHGRPRRRAAPRPRRDGRRDHRRDAPGDRLQPEQPDLDRAAVRRHRRVRRSACRATSR